MTESDKKAEQIINKMRVEIGASVEKGYDVNLSTGPHFWITFDMTPKQLEHIKLLCRFHLGLSENPHAKDRTKKLLYCLERWPRAKSA